MSKTPSAPSKSKQRRRIRGDRYVHREMEGTPNAQAQRVAYPAGAAPIGDTMTTGLSPRLKGATVWLLLGLVVFLSVQWWQRSARQTRFQVNGGVLELRRQPDGHYHWPGSVNGHPVEFLVDTGATSTAIPADMARALGLKSTREVRTGTAGGFAVGELVRADIELQGGLQAERLQIIALPGLVGMPLLGMDVLSRLVLQQQGGSMRIHLRPGAAPVDPGEPGVQR